MIEKSPSIIIEKEIKELEELAARYSTAESIVADIKVFEERVWQLYRDNLKQKQELHMKDLFKKRLYCASDEPIEDRWETQECDVDETQQLMFDHALAAVRSYVEGWRNEKLESFVYIDKYKSKLEKLNNQNQPIE